MEPVIHFQERQALWQNPIMWGVFPGMIIVISMTVSKANKSATPDWEGILVLSLILGAVLLLVFAGYLRTEISNESIRIKWFPFHLKPREIRWADIKKAELRNYSPLTEYGGWGLKGSRKNRAYNVSGDRGLQLELNDGTRVLVGTRKSEALEAVLHDLKRKSIVA